MRALNLRMRMLWTAVLLLLCAAPARGQSAATVSRTDLPPSAVLNDDVATFDRIHSDMANWSDVELAAFQNTTTQAKADCGRIEQSPHEGEESLALARLCSLGMDWDGTYSAAKWYTRRSAPAGEAQNLPLGFAMLLKADLNLQAVPRALDDLKEMQERVPFCGDTDAIFTYTLSALDVMLPKDAITAAMLRQPALLDAVAGRNATVAAGRAEAEAWHVLALLHAAGAVDDERLQKAALLAAIAQRTQPLPVTEQYVAQRGRTQYEWLGQAAPAFPTVRSTYVATTPKGTARNAARAVTATLLVVDEARAADAPALSLAVDSLRTRLAPGTQAKLVLTGPPSAERHEPHAAPVHAVYTDASLLEMFAVESGPLFVLVDGANRVQWMGAGTPAWMNPQQQAEALLARVASQ